MHFTQLTNLHSYLFLNYTHLPIWPVHLLYPSKWFTHFTGLFIRLSYCSTRPPVIPVYYFHLSTIVTVLPIHQFKSMYLFYLICSRIPYPLSLIPDHLSLSPYPLSCISSHLSLVSYPLCLILYPSILQSIWIRSYKFRIRETLNLSVCANSSIV